MFDYLTAMFIFTVIVIFIMSLQMVRLYDLAHSGEAGLKRLRRHNDAYQDVPMMTLRGAPLASSGIMSITLLFMGMFVIDADHRLSYGEQFFGIMCAIVLAVTGFGGQIYNDNIVEREEEKLRKEQQESA